MPLINLRTNLKTTSDYVSTDPSLSYGNDRPSGGSSGQPFITTDIPAGNKTVARSGPDFFVRNGILNFTQNSPRDVLRLTKWFVGSGSGYKERVKQAKEDANWNNIGSIFNFVKTLGGGIGRGLTFTAKQLALGRQEVIIRNPADTGNGFRAFVSSLVSSGANKYYNPVTTILQAGVLSAGYHLNQKGLNPIDRSYFKAGEKANGYYGTTLTANGSNASEPFVDGGNARLSILFNVRKNIKETSEEQGKIYIGAYNGDTKDGDIDYDSNNLFSYNGGPGSILGIGKTNIRIWNPTKFYTNTYIASITPNTTSKYATQYLTPTAAIQKIYTSSFSGYGSFSDTRNETYNTSKTSFNRRRANNPTASIVNPNLSISPDQNFVEGQDIIDFSFTLINNDNANAVDNIIGRNTFINFRAYIDDFSDSFNGEWDSYKYMGRAEHFYRYKGFTREMSISFMVPVLSRADMITTYQKLNALTWLTTPDYSDAGIMRGNLAYFTMGDYLRKSIVVVKSLTYTPIMEMGWDINRSQDGLLLQPGNPEYVGQLPKGMKVQCNIIPLTHQMTAQPTKDANGDVVAGVKSFYTPQKGEAFIGNREHALKGDNLTISTQYNEAGLSTPTPINGTLESIYIAKSPVSSPLFKNEK
jgi:hypothetical protein